MIAYNKQSLGHLYMHGQLSDAFEQQCISAEEVKACEEKYPVSFYKPNAVIRIGLFLLTMIITICALGFISLIFYTANASGTTALLIFFSILTYSSLEFMINKYRHYKSGVDDALLWMSGIAILSVFFISGHLSYLHSALLVLVIAGYLSLRFVNISMSAIASIAFLAVIFFGYTRLGAAAKASAPFLIMLASWIMYLIASKKQAAEWAKYYGNCLKAVSVISLISLYTAGNYYVVREASISMFHLELRENESIPFGWLFWIFTVLLPLLYLGRGIQKHNIILIRTGLLLIAAFIFTVRYYYHLLPVETAMTAGGIILIGCAYGLIKYLSKPRFGFSDEEPDSKDSTMIRQLESLAIAQTFGQGQADAGTGTTFGGGTGGGAGAGGEF